MSSLINDGFSFEVKVLDRYQLIHINSCLELKNKHWTSLVSGADSIKIFMIWETKTIDENPILALEQHSLLANLHSASSPLGTCFSKGVLI